MLFRTIIFTFEFLSYLYNYVHCSTVHLMIFSLLPTYIKKTLVISICIECMLWMGWKYTNDYQFNIIHNTEGRLYCLDINVLWISNYDIIFSIANFKTFLHIFFETMVFNMNAVCRETSYIKYNIYIFKYIFFS